MTVKTYTFSSYTLEIIHDEDAECPRKTSDNLGEMICFHRSLTIGDSHSYGAPDEIDAANYAFLVPLYMYKHSGVALSLSNKGYPFNCPWDAGQVGVVGVSKEKMLDEYGACDEDAVEKAMRALAGEVETYNQFLGGEIYGYVLKHPDGDEEDSCWGFYGDDVAKNGMLDHLPGQVVEEFNNHNYTEA